ncbi:MAG TPA: tripartite tricarboxylate transporter substrate binding protein [Burkholderiales bacterium]|jgi:tripartite-type tricarboxylate transporter receptor subunit TctC|nr:tripartite tricarboxylate transporter substrate binding protein [Burkholderiales bacterium]
MKRVSIPLLLVLTTAGVFSASGAQAAAADAGYPHKPIRMVVPFTSGSATDIMARIVGPKLTDSLGQQVVVDNRPSAGGIVAFKLVADAAPDGHTLTATGSNFSGSAALYAGKLPYDAVKDFTGVSQIATTPLVLVVGTGIGVKSAKELIALAKQKPGQLNFASTGLGSGTHYGAALFNLAAGLNVVHVPFRGSPEALTDTIAGRIHYFLSPVLAAAPLIKSGRLLALGVTTPTRSPGLPDVPTLQEAGMPGFVYEGWYGILAPAKTPRKIINLLSSELHRILELNDVKEKIAGRGAAAKWSSPEVFDKLVRDEIVTRTKVWKAAGVKVD